MRRRNDGSDIEVAVTDSPIFEGGVLTGASTIARDITEQRQMVIALHNTLATLGNALAQAQRSDERSRQFLADAAHQLRSPIAGVRACAETLLRGTSEGDRDLLLAGLVTETARAGRLISSLLRLAQVDQGVAPEDQRFDLVTLCESQVDRIRLLEPQLDVELHISVPAEPPPLDPNSLVEILSNLLDNAARHAATRIQVSVGADSANLHIVVGDDGPGIPAGTVERVFHRFVSLDGNGGSGLGLPIARGLARAQGGDLTYDRNRFLLTVPLRS